MSSTRNHMNRFIVACTLSSAIVFATCQEAKEDLKNPLSDKDVYRRIGEEIPFETAMEWIEFFEKKSGAAARLESLPACKVAAQEMKSALSSVDDLVGLAFHYGIDDFGTPHILIIPVNESMELWSSASNAVVLDANTGSAISADIAFTWAENYKSQNPAEIWFHFFGKNVFDQMQALPYFESVDIERALNPEDDSEQLLLVVWNDGQSSMGRTTAEYATVYDASNACPPCATR